MDILFLLLFSIFVAAGADADEGNGIDPHGG
jgi:hypothetical protein